MVATSRAAAPRRAPVPGCAVRVAAARTPPPGAAWCCPWPRRMVSG